MTKWQERFRRALSIFSVPDGIQLFLNLYSWESILYCFVAPFFLAVPIMLLSLAFHMHFLVFFILIIVAILISFPWVVVPFWIVKVKSGQKNKLLYWGLYNTCFIVAYAFLFIQ